MPTKSKKQQMGAGAALAAKRGEKTKIQLERRVKRNGEIHVSKAAGGFCED
jgi:hypothetical protein